MQPHKTVWNQNQVFWFIKLLAQFVICSVSVTDISRGVIILSWTSQRISETFPPLSLYSHYMERRNTHRLVWTLCVAVQRSDHQHGVFNVTLWFKPNYLSELSHKNICESCQVITNNSNNWFAFIYLDAKK